MIKFGLNASLAWEQKRADTKVVIQVSGFDDKVNILGLVIGTNKPPFFLFQAHLVGGGGGGLNRDRGPIWLINTVYHVLVKNSEGRGGEGRGAY